MSTEEIGERYVNLNSIRRPIIFPVNSPLAMPRSVVVPVISDPFWVKSKLKLYVPIWLGSFGGGSELALIVYVPIHLPLTTAGVTVTFREADNPANVAVIEADPASIAMSMPSCEMAAMAGADVLQVADNETFWVELSE